MRIRKYKFVQWIWRVFSPIFPVEHLKGIINIPAYVVSFIKFRAIGGEAKVKNLYPCLNDKTAKTSIDWHYYYQANWAFERIYKSDASIHIDIGSDVRVIGLLSLITDVFLLTLGLLTQGKITFIL